MPIRSPQGNPSFEGENAPFNALSWRCGASMIVEKLFGLSSDQYATAIEYVLIAAGIGLLLTATFAPGAGKPLAFAFALWLGLNAYVLIWLFLRVSGGPN
jgi:hypothetical protein